MMIELSCDQLRLIKELVENDNGAVHESCNEEFYAESVIRNDEIIAIIELALGGQLS